MKTVFSFGHPVRALTLVLLPIWFASASAARVDFEAPAYHIGSIVGQDGWTATSYGDNGNTFDNAYITDSPEGFTFGRQSLGIVGAPGADDSSTAHDVSKAIPQTFVDARAGHDLTLTLFFLRGEIGTGVFGLSEDGFDGPLPPALVLISDATIKALRADGTTTVIGSYLPYHQFEFVLYVDLLGHTYEVLWRDVFGGDYMRSGKINQYAGGAGGFLGDNGAPGTLTNPHVLLGARNGGTISYFDQVNVIQERVPEPANFSLVVVGATLLLANRRRQTITSEGSAYPRPPASQKGLAGC